MYLLQLVYLSPASLTPRETQHPPPLLPTPTAFLRKKRTQEKPAPGSKCPSQTQAEWEKQILPWYPLQETNDEPPPKATRGLRDLPGAALCPPANTAARGSRPAGTLSTFQQLLCKEPEFIKPLACVLSPGLQHRPCAIPQQLRGARCLQGAARPRSAPARGFPGAQMLHCSSRDTHRTSTDASRVLCSKNTSHQPAGAEPSAPGVLLQGGSKKGN